MSRRRRAASAPLAPSLDRPSTEQPDEPAVPVGGASGESPDGMPGEGLGGDFGDGVLRLRLPRRPRPHPPAPFPLAATLAPVVLSLAVWAVTRSPFALLFALLGPVVAVAGVLDGARARRRTRRHERRRFDADVERVRSRIDLAHGIERARRLSTHPASLGDPSRDAGLWREGPPEVRVGSGTVPSALRIEAGESDDTGAAGARDAADARAVDAELDGLRRRAGALTDAPLVVEAGGSVGVCGPPGAAGAVARAVVARLARSLDPSAWAVRCGGGDDWGWLDELPHARFDRAELGHRAASAPPGPRGGSAGLDAPRADAVRVDFVPAGGEPPPVGTRPPAKSPHPATASVVVAATPRELPRRCGVVISVDPERGSTLAVTSTARRRGRSDADADDEQLVPAGIRSLRPDLLSVAEARRYAASLRRVAHQEGRAGAGGLPRRVGFDRMPPAEDAASPSGLVAVLGEGDDGPVRVDLVAEGPHAVVGGTTGSGKSELLVTWVLGLAARYPPGRVTFLFVDFKGGATFAPLDPLPHRVGTVTDLDDTGARRALESLRAEIGVRERLLRDAGARSIDDAPDAAARLVIVVDEFAALAEGAPELRALFADIAARGRSLGLHLLLCTQRPAASVRDAILANCTLRVSLRVNDAADSTALIGSVAAAGLPRTPPGRALIAIAGGAPSPVQVAISDGEDIAAVSARWPAARVRRPWREPLPHLVPLAELPRGATPGAVVFGLLDRPSEQRHEPAVWVPARQGALVVLGAHASGKTTALAALAARSPGAVTVPPDVEGAWDALVTASNLLGRPADDGITLTLVLDDVDALLDRLGAEHGAEALAILGRLVRDGPRHGVLPVLSASGVSGALGAVLAGAGGRLLLRLPGRQEHLLAGGTSADFDERMPAGGGRWNGHRVQVGHTVPPTADPPAPVPALHFPPGRTTLVVSASPHGLAERLGATAARREDGTDREDGTGREEGTDGARGADAADHAGGAALRLVPVSTVRALPADGIEVGSATAHTVFVGDPDAWQSAWTLLAALRASSRMVFEGCGAGDLRTLGRFRGTPPALDPTAPHGWLLAPDGGVRRVRIGPAP